MKNSARFLWLSIAIGVLPSRAVTQGPRIAPDFRSARSEPLSVSPRPLDDAAPGTYALEGGAIGLVVLGVASYVGYNVVASSLCSGSDAGGCNDYRVHVTVGGAALGFLIGALIGHGHVKAAPNEGRED